MGGTYVPRERKHKRRARNGDMGSNKKVVPEPSLPTTQPDATVSKGGPMLAQPSSSSRAKTLPAPSAVFAEALAEGLITEADTAGMSRQKRKRFEKYLTSKLRKDENIKLIKEIEKEQRANAAATQGHEAGLFQSLRDLGRGGSVTKKEELRKELREWKAGLSDGEGLFEKRKLGEDEMDVSEDESDGPDEDSTRDDEGTARKPAVSASTTPALPVVAGIGLKRPFELDENGLPAITKRRRNGKASTGLTSFADAFLKPVTVNGNSTQTFNTGADQNTNNARSDKKSGKDEGSMTDVSWEGFSDESEEERDAAVSNPSPKVVKSALKKAPEQGAKPTPKKKVRWSLGGDDDDHVESESEASEKGSEPEASSEDDSENSESDSGSGSSSESDSDDSDSEGSDEYKKERKQQASSFVAWATQQRNAQIGFTPSAKSDEEAQFPTHHAPKPSNFAPRAPEHEPLPAGFDTTTVEGQGRVVHSVTIDRPAAIQASRLQLPIVGEEQAIMEAIHNNDVTIICGATGSGKTTQVPQFLFEAGYGAKDGPTPGMIAVTQPRRVAAVSMATRVAEELGEIGKKKVGYKIRFDGSVTSETAIKFMTEGVLLREMTDDFALSKYSAIIVDEAHERGINTDLLVGMLSRIVRLRAEQTKTKLDPSKDSSKTPTSRLKVIIMSATLRTSDFADNRRLFPIAPPVVSAEGRQHAVTMHFARRTRPDYVNEIFTKLKRAHGKLPPGGILVFLTGQDEIRRLAKLLRQALPSTEVNSAENDTRVTVSSAEVMPEDEDVALDGKRTDLPEKKDDQKYGDDSDVEITGLDGEDDENDTDSEDEFNIQDDENPEEDGPDAVSPAAIFGREKPTKVHVLPLYSQLPTKLQLRVFEPPPAGSRLIVLATNVAETSITIPGIRYVFDSGRAKRRLYDPFTGVQRLDIGWVSKAAASQRAGRAGRTGPGHCYRLYSSAIFESDFNQFDEPEIVGAPLEGVVLQLRALGLKSVHNFPFPTRPDWNSLSKAERLLGFLGALDRFGKVTPEGHRLAAYPLSPRLGRILLLGQAHDLAALSVAMVAALAVGEVFIPEIQALPAQDDDANSGSDSDSDSEGTERKSGKKKKQSKYDSNLAEDDPRRAYRRAHAILGRWDSSSDAIKLLTAICAYAHSGPASSPSVRAAWANAHFLRPKALAEATQLRAQLTSIVRAHAPGKIGGGGGGGSSSNGNGLTGTSFVDTLPQPTQKQIMMMKQIVAAGYIDQIAIRADLAPALVSGAGTSALAQLPRKPRRVGEVPYLTLFPSREEFEIAGLKRQISQFGMHDHHSSAATPGSGTVNPATAAKMATALTHFVFIHPSSVLAHQHLKSVSDLPPYVIYSRLERSSNQGSAKVYAGFPMPGRIFMHPLTTVSPAQITALANGTELLEFGKPIGRVVDLDPNHPEGGVAQKGGALPEPRREAWVVPTLVGRMTTLSSSPSSSGLVNGNGKGTDRDTDTEVAGLPSRAREWALPARRVIQRKDRLKGWVVEKVLEGVGSAQRK